jgi:hypothetical protein
MSKVISVPNKRFSDNYESVFGKKVDVKEELKEKLRQKLACKGTETPQRKGMWKRFIAAVGGWCRKSN